MSPQPPADRWVHALSPGEVTIAASVAANRQVANREANVMNLQGGPQGKMTTELVGVFGELAVAKMLNCYPDLTTHLRRGGGDLVVGDLSVDVKTTRLPNGDLRIDARSDKLVDVYVLAVADWATIRAVGYISSAEACIPQYVHMGGTGWVIPQRALHPMDILGKLRDATDVTRTLKADGPAGA